MIWIPEAFPVQIRKGWTPSTIVMRAGAPCPAQQPRPYLSDDFDNPRENGPHGALDIMAPEGALVVATNSGRVVETWRYQGEDRPGAGSSERGGNYVMLKHRDGVHTTYYAHLSKLFVRSGEKISAGEVIGEVGHTGNATCPHLHFALYNRSLKVNPFRQLKVLFDAGLWRYTGFTWSRAALWLAIGLGVGAGGVAAARRWLH